jgi:hypothetical protein
VQADSIIPRPGMAVAWDRYAYTANNPVKYTDPSGHGYCNSDNAAEDVDCSYTTERILSEFYGITLERGGYKWSDEDIRSIYLAALIIGTKLTPFVPGATTAAGAFSTIFGGLTLSLDPSISPMDGRSSADSVSLQPGRITARLLGHELGHVFAF